MNRALKIIVVKNPLMVNKDRIVESVPFRNQNLSDVLAEYAKDLIHAVVCINGRKLPAIEKERYDQVLKPGDEIIILPAIRDPISAIIAITSWVVSTAGPILLTAAINMGIAYGISYLIRAIGSSPEEADIDSNPSYGWSPVTMQRQGFPIGRAYGTNKQHGNIIAGWRTPSGGNETLSMLIAFGEGPEYGIVSGTIYLNGQPIDNYDSINIYERQGCMEQSAIFTSVKCEYQAEQEVLHKDDGGEPIVWTTPDSDFDALEIAVRYSGHYVHQDGGTEVQYVGIKIQISEHNAETWYTLVNEEQDCHNEPHQTNYYSGTNYSGGSPVTITKGKRYDIKVTKTNPGRVWDDNRKSRYLYLTTIREAIYTHFKYPGLSLLGVSAVATEDLSGSVQVSCVRKGRIVNVYDGSGWSLEWSDNPAWVIWDILTRPVISGDGAGTAYTVERYDGLEPGRLTPYLGEWYEAAQYFDDLISDGQGGYEKRIIFNGVFDSAVTVWEAVEKICAIARCEVTRIGRDYTILVDKPCDGDPVQLFSAGNIRPGTYRRNYIDLNDRTGELEIDYQDQALDYEMTPMMYVDNAIESHAAKTIEGFGITRASQAWRAMYYELAKNRILKYTVEFEADIDAIACRKGDIVLVVEPWRLGGRVISSPAANQILLDAPPSVSGDDTIAVRVNHPDTGAETVETHGVSEVSGSAVTIADTWNVIPKKDDLYAFGPTTRIVKKFRVVGITEGAEL